MSQSRALSAEALRRALLHVCSEVTSERDRLSQLDGAAGDGDLGETMAIGFGKAAERLATADPGDIGRLLAVLGTTLSREAPSTFGTLLGLGLRDAAKQVAGRGELAPSDYIALLNTLADNVAARGQVAAGQRTMLDAILAARDAGATRAAQPEATIADVLSAAAEGAAEGAAATAGMVPQVGRAGWIGERVKGSPDAGATAIAVILTALSAGARTIQP